MHILRWLSALCLTALAPLCVAAANFTTGLQQAQKFGVHEVELRGPADADCRVTFERPSGSSIDVDAFHDGVTWRARAYIDETGRWKWAGTSCTGTGIIRAVESKLRGMLRPHRDNPRQWMTEDGRWFLHIDDTAYMLFKPSETEWREYVSEDAKLGVTSLRVAALGTPAWEDSQARDIDPEQYRATDERLRWMLDHHPDMYVQLILFGLKTWGKDDTGPAWKAIPEQNRLRVMRQMIARWAAFPQIFWLVINDMHFDAAFPRNREFVREVGRYFAANDPWRHLLSAGPRRGLEFPMRPSEEPWVSYIHIEDQYEVDAEKIWKYADEKAHVFLGEDRYEHDRPTRDPKHPRYYFRRLFWSWLLQGGSASYGGRWRYMQPYSRTGSIPYATGWGQKDEHTYNQRLEGLDDVRHIRTFFEKRGIDLSKFTPVKGTPVMSRRGDAEFLVYHANGTGSGQEANVNANAAAEVTLTLPSGRYRVEWFHPVIGESRNGGAVDGGERTLRSPWLGSDAVLRLVNEPGKREADRQVSERVKQK